jgi:hypothetical protein
VNQHQSLYNVDVIQSTLNLMNQNAIQAPNLLGQGNQPGNALGATALA